MRTDGIEKYIAESTACRDNLAEGLRGGDEKAFSIRTRQNSTGRQFRC